MTLIGLLTEIGGAAGSVITVLSLLTLIIKPLRTRLVKMIVSAADSEHIKSKIAELTELAQRSVAQNDELAAEMRRQSEAIKSDLRDSILRLYYDTKKSGHITMFELCNLGELYTNYKALGGNSFIDECVQRMKELEVREDE